jgi:hypothetical protein
VKHDAPGWSVVQRADGRITWTTPTGHCCTSSPYDYRVDDEPTPGIERIRQAARPPDRPPPSITDTEPRF